MSNASKLIEIKNNIHDIKEDFEWLLNTTATNGQYFMLKSLRSRFRNTADILDSIIKDFDKKERENK